MKLPDVTAQLFEAAADGKLPLASLLSRADGRVNRPGFPGGCLV